MILKRHKHFTKSYLKLSEGEQRKVDETLCKFQKDHFSPELRNHALKGIYSGTRSISANGDLRIHYREEGNHIIVLLLTVGTHSQLY